MSTTPWLQRIGRRVGAGHRPAADEPAALTPEQHDELRATILTGGRDWLDSLDPAERAAFVDDLRRQIADEQQRLLPPRPLRLRVLDVLRQAYDVVTVPVTIATVLSSPRIHPSYGLTWQRRFSLGVRMYRNTRRIETGASYRAHLAMAAKLFEIPPSQEGVVVECGSWKGGTTTNLSLMCAAVGRELIVYDSFEGLPPAPDNDRYAWPETEGAFLGTLDEVRGNVERFGAPEVCTFRKGWFAETLPHHAETVVLSYLDVDYESSLHDCVVNLWPHLSERGYVFIDEYIRVDYCALFFSESWWAEHLGCPPPGMIGVGSGVAVGQYFLGPFEEKPLSHSPSSVAFTRKDFYGRWDYDPRRTDAVEKRSFPLEATIERMRRDAAGPIDG